MLDERRRPHSERQGTPFATMLQALTTDPALAARAGGALAALTAAGVAAGVALLLPAAITGGAAGGWALIGAGLLLGAVLATLAVGWRRARSEARRARWRVSAALGVLALGAVALAPQSLPLPAPVALALGGVVAVLATLLGLWTGSRAERAIRREAHTRRAAWYAQLRASRLTRRMIGYSAYRQLRRDGALLVPSTIHPGRTYLIPLRTTPSGARILVLDGERPIGGLCLRPREPLPDPEEALTHILAIRTDERAWLARANFFPQDRALTPQALGLAPGRAGNYDR